MKEKKENLHKETDTAFAAASILLNLLILLVLTGSLWLFYSIYNQSGQFGVMLREGFLRL